MTNHKRVRNSTRKNRKIDKVDQLRSDIRLEIRGMESGIEKIVKGQNDLMAWFRSFNDHGDWEAFITPRMDLQFRTVKEDVERRIKEITNDAEKNVQRTYMALSSEYAALRAEFDTWAKLLSGEEHRANVFAAIEDGKRTIAEIVRKTEVHFSSRTLDAMIGRVERLEAKVNHPPEKNPSWWRTIFNRASWAIRHV